MPGNDLVRRERMEAVVQQCAEELVCAGLAHRGRPRFLLGIAGPPAAGKSTFADELVAAINHLMSEQVAALVPMDGFHYSNVILDEIGLRALKGAPETFDAQGFVDLLGRLRRETSTAVWCPRYDRALHDRVEHAIPVDPSALIIVVEGNYLLLDVPPWDQVHGELDQVWYLDAPPDARIRRLVQRHIAGGRTLEQALDKIKGTDDPNAALIEGTRKRADRVLYLMSDQ